MGAEAFCLKISCGGLQPPRIDSAAHKDLTTSSSLASASNPNSRLPLSRISRQIPSLTPRRDRLKLVN